MPECSSAQATPPKRSSVSASYEKRRVTGWAHEGGDVQPLVAVVTERDRPLAFGRPDPAQDRLQANAVLVGRPDLDRLARVLRPLLGDGLLQLF